MLGQTAEPHGQDWIPRLDLQSLLSKMWDGVTHKMLFTSPDNASPSRSTRFFTVSLLLLI